MLKNIAYGGFDGWLLKLIIESRPYKGKQQFNVMLFQAIIDFNRDNRCSGTIRKTARPR